MAKGTGVELRIVLVFILIAAGYMIYQKYGIPLQIADTSSAFLYDTDTQNNAFIKGDLSTEQLKKLDILLEKEKASGGNRLTTKQITRITRHDQELYDAYYRWRRCREMMRSKHRSVYPSERYLYKKK